MTEPCLDCRETGSLHCPDCYSHRPRARHGQGNRSNQDAKLRKLKMTLDEYNVILASQNGVCALCAQTCKTGKQLAVDHNHMCCPSGTACSRCWRGLLCFACNTGLGKFMDSPDLLRKAADYIESFPLS